MAKQKVALLTAGGIAPCLSSAVGGLIERYTELAPEVEIIGYLNGYMGLLQGKSVQVTAEVRAQAPRLHKHGGTPIGNSRVKLTNVKDCLKRGLVKEGENPLEVAARQLTRDGITVLHTIGGDDTNTTAADLAAFLKKGGYGLTVVGLPKTIDNDIIPIKQSLGAWTAAEETARFFSHVVNEQSCNPRMLIIHEVMGRHCGWLTAASAYEWRKMVDRMEFVPGFNFRREHLDIDAVYLPELEIDFDAEAKRLTKRLDEKDCVNIFLAEGAGIDGIVAKLEAVGQKVERDAFGHVKLDFVNPGKWFGDSFAKAVKAEKTLVQKGGYFCRSAAPNADDLRLIKSCTDYAVDCALRGEAGLVGHDEERGGLLRAIEFERVKGGKHFDVKQEWFQKMLWEIGQVQR